MYRLVSCFLLLTLLMAGSVEAASNKTLLTIDGTRYTTQDYRDWWEIWQEPEMVFPDTPQGFIDYLLFVEEGRMMEYDLKPEYQRKMKVFLTVRGLAALKSEEVDNKINITEKQIRESFAKNYAPVWSMQILSYADKDTAQAVADDLKAFNGQKAGRLVFADRAGVKVEDGGPLNYDEVSIDPATIIQSKSEHWLEVINKLQKWFVSEPFFLEEQNKYVVIRMDDIDTALIEEIPDKQRNSIRKKLRRKAVATLTSELLERLKREQHVEIDEELLAKVNRQDDYPQEILEQPVVQMDGFTFSVGLLIQNLKNQQKLRRGLDEERLKAYVVNTVITQQVTNNEAINRLYKDRPPLKGVYNFYSNNTLRKFFESGIRTGIKVSAEEVKSYYDNNPSLYAEPEKISYVLLQGNNDLLNTIYAAISQGADFFDQAKNYSFEAKIRTLSVGRILPDIREQLDKLKKNEVGAPFALGQNYGLLRLLNRAQGQRAPLEQVREEIEGVLAKEKFVVKKAAYLKKLRSRTEITVKQGVWKKLKKEYVK